MSDKPLILVTGTSSFVGSHVVLELLKEGYSVRGTARGGKLDALRSTIGAEYPKTLEIVQIDDVATDDFTDVLKGITAVIHVASPLAGRVPPKEAIETALNGTLNVLKQAVAANITKVVITSSWGTTVDPGLREAYDGVVYTRNDWGTGTEEDILDGTHDPLWIYLATKGLAEKAAWKFAEEHPELDLATINPPFIYGPFAPSFPVPTAPTELGTNRMVYALISGSPDRPLPMQLPPFFCDVRDVAKAHVAALKAPPQPLPSPTTPIKRFLVYGGAFTWKEAIGYIGKTFPTLKHRLPVVPDLADGEALPGKLSSIDCTPAKDLLGMDIAGYVKWEKTVEDTIHSLLIVEKNWL